jgi:hypothetical protein
MIGSGVGSVAIVGEPRVGKSSVATALLENQIAAGSGNVFGLEINLGADADVDTDLIQVIFADVYSLATSSEADPALPSYGSYRALKRLLRDQTTSGKRYVVVLDEFDAVSDMERADLSIRRLREILSKPAEYGLSAILVSRRRIPLLEKQIPDLSTLDGVCGPVFLCPLSLAGVVDMVSRGWTGAIADEVAKQVYALAGGHPFLSEALLFGMVEGLSLLEAELEVAGVFRSYFAHLSKVLEEDDALQTLIGIVKGENSFLSDKVDILARYGVIREIPGNPGRYGVTVAAFGLYLQEESDPIVAWPTDV